jgi:hypothetical protein
MLKEAHIQNFQSIKDLKLNLDYPIVVITGPTDEGKSAILRAIKNPVFDGIGGNFYRKERGADGVSVVSKTMSVSLKSDRGSVQWLKSKTDATYIINGDDRRENCGRVIPEDVPKALGLTSEASVGENLHYRSQFDGAFLLKDRGAKECYRFISRLMGADVVISAVNDLEKNSRELAKSVKASEKTLSTLQINLDSYFSEEDIELMKTEKDYIFQDQRDLKVLKEKVAALKKVSLVTVDLQGLKDEEIILSNRFELQSVFVRDIKKILSDVEGLTLKAEALEGIKNTSDDLSVAVSRMSNASWLESFSLALFKKSKLTFDAATSLLSDLKAVALIQKSLSEIVFPAVFPVAGLTEDYLSFVKKNGEREKQKDLLTAILSLSSDIKTIDSDIVLTNGTIKEYEKDLPAMLEAGNYVVTHGSSKGMPFTVSGRVFISEFNDFAVAEEGK